MDASQSMRMILVIGCLLSAVSSKSIRGFENEVARKLASPGPSCWSWCDRGNCSWSLSGCQCVCENNYKGACCTDMELCGPEKDACPQSMLTYKSVDVSSLLDSPITLKFRSDIGPRVQHQGPVALQGLFWLTEQKDSSSLISFARSYDGGSMGQGVLSDGEYAISIRVGGDRGWSFADGPGVDFDTVGLLDLVYHFRLTAGTLENPSGFEIVPEVRNPEMQGGPLSDNYAEWLFSFSMNKLTAEEATAAGFGGSIVWDRISSPAGQDIESARYLAVQIVDGDANPIQPAYMKWVAYMNSSEAGNSPGKIHYREALTNDGTL